MDIQQVQYLAVRDNKNALIHLPLEFEGSRAFAIWDSVRCGEYQFKARIEVDPKRLRKTSEDNSPFEYEGKLVLPTPECN